MKTTKTQSEFEIYIKGTRLIICEYRSHGLIEKLLKLVEVEYGVVFDEGGHSKWCG
jgi:hypothetical protein